MQIVRVGYYLSTRDVQMPGMSAGPGAHGALPPPSTGGGGLRADSALAGGLRRTQWHGLMDPVRRVFTTPRRGDDQHLTAS